MARADLLKKLMFKSRSKYEFNFDALVGPHVYDILSVYDIQLLDDISKDPRLITKLDERLKMNDQILGSKGFMRMTQGTNRAVYKYLNDQSFVLKTAISVKGREDSPKELKNQHLLKPFVAKCFSVSPTGVVGTFERVEDITSKEQFYNIADLVFDLLNHIIGEYVIADAGTNFFRNYGIRIGFGPVLLDYPLLYKLDGKKLFCNAFDPFNGVCGGGIDYDEGFNFLHCERCNKQYSASQLEQKIENNAIEVVGIEGSVQRMKITVTNKDEKGNVVKVLNEANVGYMSSNTYIKTRRYQREERKPKELHVTDSSEGIEQDDNPAILNSLEFDMPVLPGTEAYNEEDVDYEENVNNSEGDNDSEEENNTSEDTGDVSEDTVNDISYEDEAESDEDETEDEPDEDEIYNPDEVTHDFYQHGANIISFMHEIIDRAKEGKLNYSDFDSYINLVRVSISSMSKSFSVIDENNLIQKLMEEADTEEVIDIIEDTYTNNQKRKGKKRPKRHNNMNNY